MSKRCKVQLNKSDLLQRIIEALKESLAVLEKAARAAHAEATHESSKAENKYDTRGLEAAYLAGGQARQAREILESIKVYGALQTKTFGGTDPIDVSAVVELKTDGEPGIYFEPAPFAKASERILPFNPPASRRSC